jgi:HSP20 family protein
VLLTAFDPFVAEFDRVAQRAFGRTIDRSRAALPMDGIRRQDDFLLRFDLPGIKLEDLDVSVDRGVLTVSATRTEEKAEGDKPFVRERVTGSLRRRIYLGDSVDADNVEAAYADGVLTVRVPVAEKAKARKVEIGTTPEKMISA